MSSPLAFMTGLTSAIAPAVAVVVAVAVAAHDALGLRTSDQAASHDNPCTLNLWIFTVIFTTMVLHHVISSGFLRDPKFRDIHQGNLPFKEENKSYRAKPGRKRSSMQIFSASK